VTARLAQGSLARRVAAALEAAGPRARRLAVASAVLRCVERSLFVGAAMVASRGALVHGAGVVVLLAGIAAARAALRSALSVHARAAVHVAAADALLAGDPLVSSPLPDEDTQYAVLEGIDAAERLAAVHAPDAAGDLGAAVIVVALLLATEPPATVAVGGGVVVAAVAVVALARRFTQRETERAWTAYVPVMNRMVDLYRGRLEIMAHGLGRPFRAELDRMLAEHGRVSVRAHRLVGAAGRAPVAVAAIALGLSVAAESSRRGVPLAHTVIDAAILVAALPALVGVATNLHEVVRTSSRLGPMLALLDARAPLREGAGAPPPELPASIAWEHVSFAYAGSSRDALADASITWSPGRVLVITGPNGSGKSTCLRLLVGLAPPRAGRVAIADRDLAGLDLARWRARVAYLPQSPCLPERATVREAMRLVAPDATDDRLCAALDRVALLGVLEERAPAAPLDVRAAALSAGQRQRLALARVLARDASLVLLDEPDANLDAAGVQLVARLVQELRAEAMVAVVAHTPELAALDGATRVELSAPAPRDATA
jgi:ATP-binding cassette subfamily C protein CydCD